MKRIIIFATIFTIIAIQSCTKDEIVKTDNVKEQNNIDRMTYEGDDTEAKVLSFIERIDLVRENSDYAGSENWNYSQQGAVWNIDAAFNYRYAYPNNKRGKLLVDSLPINIKLMSDFIFLFIAG